MQFSEYVNKLLSVSSTGEFFDNEDILRFLSHKEILGASEELNVDFIELKLIPCLIQEIMAISHLTSRATIGVNLI